MRSGLIAKDRKGSKREIQTNPGPDMGLILCAIFLASGPLRLQPQMGAGNNPGQDCFPRKREKRLLTARLKACPFKTTTQPTPS